MWICSLVDNLLVISFKRIHLLWNGLLKHFFKKCFLMKINTSVWSNNFWTVVFYVTNRMTSSFWGSYCQMWPDVWLFTNMTPRWILAGFLQKMLQSMFWDFGTGSWNWERPEQRKDQFAWLPSILIFLQEFESIKMR